MPRFLVYVSRMETYAEIEVEALNEDDAKERALATDALNMADWLVSEGNFVRRDDCDVYACEEIDSDDTPPPPPMDNPATPPAILAALEHVRSFAPEVTTVTFLAGQVWLYTSDDGHTPAFPQGMDTALLEDALDAAYEDRGLPSVYRITASLP